ncbi:hypothetical protein MSG28_006229 [Choristoneura fumiferana]|uniref:Uncharacterized protein n=1 Tax=Choristoneura fumiferana TaxID=7141 RepID=A0ACC0JEA6_CHOFU|nr:hypothetical protein MSG28_006229 [Choristoneura fumiferana]
MVPPQHKMRTPLVEPALVFRRDHKDRLGEAMIFARRLARTVFVALMVPVNGRSAARYFTVGAFLGAGQLQICVEWTHSWTYNIADCSYRLLLFKRFHIGWSVSLGYLAAWATSLYCIDVLYLTWHDELLDKLNRSFMKSLWGVRSNCKYNCITTVQPACIRCAIDRTALHGNCKRIAQSVCSFDAVGVTALILPFCSCVAVPMLAGPRVLEGRKYCDEGLPDRNDTKAVLHQHPQTSLVRDVDDMSLSHRSSQPPKTLCTGNTPKFVWNRRVGLIDGNAYNHVPALTFDADFSLAKPTPVVTPTGRARASLVIPNSLYLRSPVHASSTYEMVLVTFMRFKNLRDKATNSMCRSEERWQAHIRRTPQTETTVTYGQGRLDPLLIRKGHSQDEMGINTLQTFLGEQNRRFLVSSALEMASWKIEEPKRVKVSCKKPFETRKKDLKEVKEGEQAVFCPIFAFSPIPLKGGGIRKAKRQCFMNSKTEGKRSKLISLLRTHLRKKIAVDKNILSPVLDAFLRSYFKTTQSGFPGSVTKVRVVDRDLSVPKPS